MLKTILITTFTALFLSLLLPAFAFSGAWNALGGFLVVQTLHVVLSAPLTAAMSLRLAHVVRGRWLYPLAALLGAIVHAVLTPLYLRWQVSLLPAADSGPAAVWLVLLAILVGPVIGLLAAWAAGRQPRDRVG